MDPYIPRIITDSDFLGGKSRPQNSRLQRTQNKPEETPGTWTRVGRGYTVKNGDRKMEPSILGPRKGRMDS